MFSPTIQTVEGLIRGINIAKDLGDVQSVIKVELGVCHGAWGKMSVLTESKWLPFLYILLFFRCDLRCVTLIPLSATLYPLDLITHIPNTYINQTHTTRPIVNQRQHLFIMSNVLQTHGNETTMNLNSVIYQNIVTSPYLKTLVDMSSYQEVLNEAIRNVRSMEPFLKGSTPSTAWVLMYKFWTLPLTVRQLEAMIDHPTSVYVRGIAFLYLRFVCKPDQLWDWFGAYLEDDAEIYLQGGHKPIISTIGKMCYMLLKDQKFLGQMMPRIPVLIMRDLEQKLEPYGARGGGGKGGRHNGKGGGGRDRDRDRDHRGGSRRDDRDDRGDGRGYRRSRDDDRDHGRSRYDDDRDRGRGGRDYYDRDREGDRDRDRDYRRRRSYSRSRSPSRDRHRHRDRSRSPRRY